MFDFAAYLGELRAYVLVALARLRECGVAADDRARHRNHVGECLCASSEHIDFLLHEGGPGREHIVQIARLAHSGHEQESVGDVLGQAAHDPGSRRHALIEHAAIILHPVLIAFPDVFSPVPAVMSKRSPVVYHVGDFLGSAITELRGGH